MILTNVKNLTAFLIILTTLSNFTGCSSVPETTETKAENEADEDYIFDEIPENNVLKYNSKETVEENFYFQIQIGAFSTRERAVKFKEFSKQKLNRECVVLVDDKRKLFLVRLAQLFISKSEAELILEMITSKDGYKDAWIVKEIKN